MYAHVDASIDGGSSLGKASYKIVIPAPTPSGEQNEQTAPTVKHGWIMQANAIDEEDYTDLNPDSSTVTLKGKTWTVGSSARYITHETNLRAAKSSTILIRVLGMLGLILKKEGITQTNLKLKVLLPVGEQNNFKAIEQLLTKALFEVAFNGSKPGIRPSSVRVFPEGAGVARSIDLPSALVLMFGHKDISILPVRSQGIQAEACRTLAGLGMVALINAFPCNLKDELLVAEFLHKEATTGKGLVSLVGEDGLEGAKHNFAGAKAKVWRRVLQQLSEEPNIKTAPKIYITGGSAALWKDELKTAFGNRLVYLTEPCREMTKLFPELKQAENKALQTRFVDSYLLLRGESNA